ncbi:MAG: LLM class flavin-dependent oxidoreductase [Acidimicrobiales bacterium]
MKVGITLPQFDDAATDAVAAARRAEALGFDGVFCFDHLWPIGQPGRPALSASPLLGAVAASTSTIALGTLVARIGLVPDDVLVATLSGLSVLSGGRFIAGVGTGDRISREENLAFGVPFEGAEDRWYHLVGVAGRLAARGVPVWVGGNSAKAIETARTLGVAINLWASGLDAVAAVAGQVEVTWGGPVGGTVPAMRHRLDALEGAGARWAVCAWPESLDDLAEAAEAIDR